MAQPLKYISTIMNNKIIYIIDDDIITVFGIRKLLKAYCDNQPIPSFENGHLAFDTIVSQIESGKEIPDIIFLDINMPIMDGWQFLEALSKLNISKKIKINIITSSIDSADYEKWLYYQKITPHCLNFMNKPILKILPEDISFMDKAS